MGPTGSIDCIELGPPQLAASFISKHTCNVAYWHIASGRNSGAYRLNEGYPNSLFASPYDAAGALNVIAAHKNKFVRNSKRADDFKTRPQRR